MKGGPLLIIDVLLELDHVLPNLCTYVLNETPILIFCTCPYPVNLRNYRSN